jgi:hypothetical protein
MRIEQFEDRAIVLSGIGLEYTQNGMPIDISICILEKKGFEVSTFHLIDELVKLGFNYAKVRSILIEADKFGTKEKLFIEADYERQRQMIYNYLFTDYEQAKKFFYKVTVDSKRLG